MIDFRPGLTRIMLASQASGGGAVGAHPQLGEDSIRKSIRPSLDKMVEIHSAVNPNPNQDRLGKFLGN